MFDTHITDSMRLTIDVPDDLHEAFLTKCFLAKPRTSMKARIIEFMARETGKPMPKMIDRRKLTKVEREQAADSPKPRKPK